jgi:uncharacterized membrane protein
MSEMLEQCRAMMEAMMSGVGSSMGGMMPMGGGMDFAMVLVSLAWLVLLAVAVAVAWLILHGRGRPAEPDSRRILDVRYARGELDRETFLVMRADLKDSAPATG